MTEWDDAVATWDDAVAQWGALFPNVALPTIVELYVDGAWLDVTEYVIGDAGINITRGRSDEADHVDRSVCRLTLNNRDGRFSPRDPTGPYYGQIGRNTPLRVSTYRDGTLRRRFWGEVSSWPQRWDRTGRDVRTPLEASGVLRRLSSNALPLRSTLYRGITNLIDLVAYWPAEDERGSTSIASAVDGGTPMRLVGDDLPTFASNDDFAASAPLPVLNNSDWRGKVPWYVFTGEIQVRFVIAVPTAGSVDNETLVALDVAGTTRHWKLVYGTGGTLTLQAFDEDNTLVLNAGPYATNVDGRFLRVSVELWQNGTAIHYRLRTLELGVFTGDTFEGDLSPLATNTITGVGVVYVNPGGGHEDVALGHISVQKDVTDLFELGDELNAYVGEAAGRRIERLCDEEGVEFTSVGDLDDTHDLGAQTRETLVDLLFEAADADMGILYEPMTALGLAYRARTSLYDQTATLTLDYSAAELSEIEPVDDDLAVFNDVTVTRKNGSSYRRTVDSGPLSLASPPDGIGRYATAVTVNVSTDTQLPDQAGWRLRLATVDELRFPELGLHLSRDAYVDDTALLSAVLDVDLGDLVVVENVEIGVPPGDVTQLVQGWRETLDNFQHRLTFNTSPASSWSTVAIYDTSRYASTGTTLNEALDTTETGVDVTTAVPPYWTTAAGSLPFDVVVGGERMTVTAVTGTTANQTFTVTRSVNGVVKSHASGDVVDLAEPSYYGL